MICNSKKKREKDTPSSIKYMEIFYMLSCIGTVKHIDVYTDKVENNQLWKRMH